MKKLAVLPVLLLLAVASLGRADESESERLHAVFREAWERTMEEHPTWASSLGDRRWNDRWEDRSPEAFARRRERRKATLERLATIDRARLGPRDRLTLDLFRKDLETQVAGGAFSWHLLPMDQRGGLQSADDLADRLRFETPQDYADWLARLRAFPVLVDQTIALMREGARTRWIHPRIVLERIPAQVKKQLVADPRESPFWKPFRRPGSTLGDEAAAAIASGVVPAFRRLDAFLRGEYLPAAFTEVGAWQLPQGEAFYAHCVRRNTTKDVSAREVHELGLREVARIRGEMERLKERSGFKGTLAEFFTFLRTDPRFFYASGGELLEGYRALSKRIDPRLVRLFRTLPRMPYGVEPIPDKIAPDTTTAYYTGPAGDGSRAGTFWVNLYKPEARPKWEMMALALHESVPGHHLQIALAQEQGELPPFRRYGGYTAFIEGWGLYAESLGEDMGLYDDPYAKFGQLTYEMWRAVRLVVDTGMHAFKWDRARAIAFFLENAPKTELDVTNEIDRYIAWPGQALAYKVGELELKRLRARAKERLGERFDLREFHEVVLSEGALPLDVLAGRVEEWLEARARRHYR